MIDKTGLRKYFLNLRKHISSKERQQAETKILDLFSSTHAFKKSKKIACYLSIGSELSTQSIIKIILYHKKDCFLPVLFHDSLIFTQYQLEDELKLNQYSILEPTNLKNKTELQDLDIIILPLAAFDRRGGRLGWGYGYYDKTLCNLRDLSKRPQLIGVAFALQEAEMIPQDPWDISLDAVITEKEVVYCGRDAPITPSV